MHGIKGEPNYTRLTERLIAYEAAVDRASRANFSDTCHVCERLRRALAKLFGPDGYRMLMARAFVLAKREAPQLIDVKVNDDGFIEGLTGKATEANGMLTSRFLEHGDIPWRNRNGVASERYMAGPARYPSWNSGEVTEMNRS